MISNRPPMGEGWIARHRSVREHWLVGHGLQVTPADPSRAYCLSRGEAWEDLLMECRYEDGFVYNAGKKMRIERGSLVGAVSYLGARWNWTPQTVRTFLDKLENDGMIKRSIPGSSECNKHIGKAATVLSVCNYERYQDPDYSDEDVQQQTNNKQTTNKQQMSNNIYKDNKGTKEQDNPPTPHGGKRSPKAKKPLFTEAEIASTDAAFESWNGTAKALGLGVVQSVTEQRRRRLAARLADIGGLENFRLALSAIPAVPFLMGKVPPKPGQEPFKLDIERLMQTDGNLGDVLAKLIDKACEQPTAPGAGVLWWQDAEKVAQISDDQWREMISQWAGKVWPPDKLGPAPGSKRCVVPARIIVELRLTEKYDANGISKLAR